MCMPKSLQMKYYSVLILTFLDQHSVSLICRHWFTSGYHILPPSTEVATTILQLLAVATIRYSRIIIARFSLSVTWVIVGGELVTRK